jgi:hypothetical protein
MDIRKEELQPLTTCPVCDKRYRDVRMLVVSEAGKRTTLHITCEHCQAKSIVFVSVTPFGVVSMGVLTDLQEGEVRRFFDEAPISPDQVLEVHEFLKQYEGGVEAFIGS